MVLRRQYRYSRTSMDDYISGIYLPQSLWVLAAAQTSLRPLDHDCRYPFQVPIDSQPTPQLLPLSPPRSLLRFLSNERHSTSQSIHQKVPDRAHPGKALPRSSQAVHQVPVSIVMPSVSPTLSSTYSKTRHLTSEAQETATSWRCF